MLHVPRLVNIYHIWCGLSFCQQLLSAKGVKLNVKLNKISKVIYVSSHFNWPPYKIVCDGTLAMIPSFRCKSFMAVILFYGKTLSIFPDHQHRKPQARCKVESINACVYVYCCNTAHSCVSVHLSLLRKQEINFQQTETKQCNSWWFPQALCFVLPLLFQLTYIIIWLSLTVERCTLLAGVIHHLCFFALLA